MDHSPLHRHVGKPTFCAKKRVARHRQGWAFCRGPSFPLRLTRSFFGNGCVAASSPSPQDDENPKHDVFKARVFAHVLHTAAACSHLRSSSPPQGSVRRSPTFSRAEFGRSCPCGIVRSRRAHRQQQPRTASVCGEERNGTTRSINLKVLPSKLHCLGSLGSSVRYLWLRSAIA